MHTIGTYSPFGFPILFLQPPFPTLPRATIGHGPGLPALFGARPRRSDPTPGLHACKAVISVTPAQPLGSVAEWIVVRRFFIRWIVRAILWYGRNVLVGLGLFACVIAGFHLLDFHMAL